VTGGARSITFRYLALELSRLDNGGYVGWVRQVVTSPTGESAPGAAESPGVNLIRASRGPTAVLG